MNFPPKKSVDCEIFVKTQWVCIELQIWTKILIRKLSILWITPKIESSRQNFSAFENFLCKCLCLERLSWTQIGWFLIQDPRKTVPALDQGKVGPHITMPRLSRPIQIAWCFTIANKVRESYKIEWWEEIANCSHRFCESRRFLIVL